MDDSEDIRRDIGISPFASDVYRASIFYQRHLDFACLSALSFVLVFTQEHPRLQLSLTLAILVLHIGSVLWGRPYTMEASFNHIVRICANCVAIVGAIASFLSYSDGDARGTATASSKTLVAFSYFMLVLCIGLVFLFVASFFFTLVIGARLDHQRVRKRRKAERKLVFPVAVTSEAVGDAYLSPADLLRVETLSEATAVWPVLSRDQRVSKIRPVNNAIANLETGNKATRRDGNPVFMPQTVRSNKKVKYKPTTKHFADWTSQGIECQANPLYVTPNTDSMSPPDSRSHTVSEW
jgi:hypothetical protein